MRVSFTQTQLLPHSLKIQASVPQYLTADTVLFAEHACDEMRYMRAVPEPSTLALLGMALMALGVLIKTKA